MNKYSILVVEDEALIAANLVQTLSSLGYTVPEPVATGEDAIRAVKTQHPDLVLMDIKLIGAMDGIEAAEKIRAIADIPIVYLTAYTDNLRLKKAQLTEPYGYIVKPTHSRELHATIEMAMYKHALDRKLKESEERYRTLVASVEEAIILQEKTGKILTWNRAAERLFGVTAREVLGHTTTSRKWKTIREDGTEFLDSEHPSMHTLATGEACKNVVMGITSAEGRFSWVNINTNPLFREGDAKPYAVVILLLDITERKRAEVTLQRQSATLSILNDIISTANKADDLLHLLNSILEESLRLLDFDAGGIYLVDRSTRTANVVHSKNLPPEFLSEIQTLPIDKKPYDMLFIQNEPIITENYAQIAPDRSKRYGFQSIASIPLLSKGVAIGALNIASMRRHVISLEDKQTLISIGRELGSTIERMAAEEEVKKAAKNLETLFNSIDEMIFVLDMQGHILAVNDTVQKRLSYTSEELIGTDVLQLHVPERRDEALYIVQRMIAGTIDSCPVPVRAKDGTRIEVETKVTRGWWNGEEVLIGVTRDVTERKKADETLRETNEYLHKLIDFANAPIIVWDPDFRITRFNHAFEHLTGRTEQEVIGQPLGILFPKKTRATSRALIKKTLAGERWETVEIPILTSDGTIRTVLWNSANILTADAKLFSTIAQGVDITERKQAADTLALTARKLSLMNDVTYQYIQNKVTGLRGYAELSKDAKTEAERLSFIEKEEHVLADIHHLIKNTQEYQEIGLLLPQWIPVEQSIRIAVSLVSPKQDISIESALHGLELYSDPLIEKIFANLIENAVLHGKTTRHITFSCKETPEGLILICEDDGVGISPKDKARLFDRLVGEKIRFGLFFVRECLLLSGMTIAETGEPGKGARFEIHIPSGMWRKKGASE